RHPARRDEGSHRKVDPQLLLFRDRLPLQLSDRLLEDPAVGVEAHGRDVAVLLSAEQVAGAPDLEIAERDPEPRSERLVTRDRRQALVRLLGQLTDGREEEVGERTLTAPA